MTKLTVAPEMGDPSIDDATVPSTCNTVSKSGSEGPVIAQPETAVANAMSRVRRTGTHPLTGRPMSRWQEEKRLVDIHSCVTAASGRLRVCSEPKRHRCAL